MREASGHLRDDRQSPPPSSSDTMAIPLATTRRMPLVREHVRELPEHEQARDHRPYVKQ